MTTSSQQAPSPGRIARLLAQPEHGRCLMVLATLELAVTLLAWRTGHASTLLWGWPVGILIWTLAEYLLHRYAFHLPPEHPLARFGAHHHHAHHQAPNTPPITKPLKLTLPVLAVVIGAAAMLGSVTLSLAAGVVGGYLLYEVSHVATHVLGQDHPLPLLRDGHLRHHEKPEAWFGITSPLWDYIFRTDESPK